MEYYENKNIYLNFSLAANIGNTAIINHCQPPSTIASN